MFDTDNMMFGTCLLLASIGYLLSKKHVSALKPLTTPLPMQKAALIDLKIPYGGSEGLQHCLNDEVLSKCTSDSMGRYYVCVYSDARAPRSSLINYMSTLFSKLWNEALLKNCLGMECIVVSDDLKAGLMTREEILCRSELSTVYSDRSPDLASINAKRASLGHGPLELVDTHTFTKVLQNNFSKGQHVKFLEDFSTANPVDMPMYAKMAMGGTFDLIHHGHRKLLTLAAASCTDVLTIGITGDSMLSSKSHASRIAGYAQRCKNVRDFLSLVKPSLPVNIVELSDQFGPTITDGSLEAIIVSSETINGAFKINELRKEKGMSDMKILVTYRSESAVLSSSFLRDRHSQR